MFQKQPYTPLLIAKIITIDFLKNITECGNYAVNKVVCDKPSIA